MKPIMFSLQFRGRAKPLRSDRLRFDLAAPSSALVTTVGPGGISAALEDVPGAEARLESELSFDGSTTFEDAGVIELGRGHLLHLRSVGVGRLDASPDPNLKHGAVVLELQGGTGQFAGAEGLISSNFLVSETGEVTENHLGLVFVHDRPNRTERR